MLKLFDKETTEKGKRIVRKSGKNVSRVIGYNKGFKAMGKTLENERIRFIIDLNISWGDSVTIDFDVIDDKPVLKKVSYRNDSNDTIKNQSYINDIIDALIKNWE